MRINYGLEGLGNFHFEYYGDFDDHERIRNEIAAIHAHEKRLYIIGWAPANIKATYEDVTEEREWT